MVAPSGLCVGPRLLEESSDPVTDLIDVWLRSSIDRVGCDSYQSEPGCKLNASCPKHGAFACVEVTSVPAVRCVAVVLTVVV
jgi:hypothetical protein